MRVRRIAFITTLVSSFFAVQAVAVPITVDFTSAAWQAAIEPDNSQNFASVGDVSLWAVGGNLTFNDGDSGGGAIRDRAPKSGTQHRRIWGSSFQAHLDRRGRLDDQRPLRAHRVAVGEASGDANQAV